MSGRDGGLPKFFAALQDLFGDRLTVTCREYLGRLRGYGKNRPLPSSAARLRVEGHHPLWVQWPQPGSLQQGPDGVAATFLCSGRQYFFPTIRLKVRVRRKCHEAKAGLKYHWEFLTFDDWLADALTQWVFPLSTNSVLQGRLRDADRWPIRGGCTRLAADLGVPESEIHDALAQCGQTNATLFGRLQEGSLKVGALLQAIANLVEYALWGDQRSGASLRYPFLKLGFKLPHRDPWLRAMDAAEEDWAEEDVESTDGESEEEEANVESGQAANLAIRSLRSEVLSAEVFHVTRTVSSEPQTTAWDDDDLRLFFEFNKDNGVPRLGRSNDLRLDVTGLHQAPGIDPFHTPESDDARSRLHLGEGVVVTRNRGLSASDNREVALSASSVRLPFAGFNDPRRLLMAAKAQCQAVRLAAEEPPLVVTGVGQDPPGVNLRVGYLAWAGWNHEDAWVLSQSAAKKLTRRQTWMQTIAIAAMERGVETTYRVGDGVEKGQRLIRRQLAPSLYWPTAQDLGRWIATQGESVWKDDVVEMPSEDGDTARHAGTIIRIEILDLIRRQRIIPREDGGKQTDSLPYELHPELRGAYRKVVRYWLRRDLPLQVGDKLANRHGHKGVVGRILPDEAMPSWHDKPLECIATITFPV